LSEHYPGRSALEQFARAEIPVHEERHILEHLRAGCTICQRTIDDLLPHSTDPPGPEADFDLEPQRRPWPAVGGWTLPQLGPECNAPHPLVPVPPVRCGGAPRRPAAGNDLAAALAALAADERRKHPDEPLAETGVVPVGAPREGTATPPAMTATARASDDERWNRMFARLEPRIAVFAAQQQEAPALLRELLAQRPARRTALVGRNARFQTLSLCDLLLEHSLDTAARDPRAATALADLSLEMAKRLEGRDYGLGVIQDMRARAWGYRANASRLSLDLAGAEQALSLADSLAEDGSADPLEEARLLDLRAALCFDHGWYVEATELIQSVIEIYDDVKDLHRKGRSLIAQGVCYGGNSSSQKAVEHIKDGLRLLDHDLEPDLVPLARENLAWFLYDCGHSGSAQAEIDSLRQTCADRLDDSAELRLRWLEARLARRAGRPDEAEQRLCQLRQDFTDRGLRHEASMVILDLAILLYEQGRTLEARLLTEEMMPALQPDHFRLHADATLAAARRQAAADSRRHADA
jgi:tetratricopeptide (TPR) repeat protein